MLAYAIVMGRILVLPPPLPLTEQIKKGKRKSSNKETIFGFEDIFHDLHSIPHCTFMTMQDFLESVVVTGQVKDEVTGE